LLRSVHGPVPPQRKHQNVRLVPPARHGIRRGDVDAATSHLGARNHRMSRVLGAEVRYRSGQKIGDLQDLVVDSQGKLMLAIVSTGGWLGLKGRVHAVPWEVLRTANDGTRVLDMERAQLSRVPVAVAVTRSVRPCDAA
jgi:sporulation protein YlmC with PRC-barrel domain